MNKERMLHFLAGLLACLFLMRTPLCAQERPELDSTYLAVADSASHVKHKSKFMEFVTKRRNYLVAPQFDRSPETGILTGIYYLQLYKNKRDSATRTSNTETFLSFTQKKQYIVELNETILFHKEKYILRGSSIITRYNEYFFGIGNNHDLRKKDTIEFNLFQTTQRLTRVITKKFFAGLQYQYYQTYNVDYRYNSILATDSVYGRNGSISSGIGPVFLYDTRDNVIYTRTGAYVDISAMFVRKEFGSTCQFFNFTLDARKFIKFYKNDVICFQYIMNYNQGNVPFRQLGMLGSDIMMRGYYMGSYRDKVMTCGQVEFRIPVWKFIGMTLFGAAGEVQPDLQSMNWDDVKFTYGFGLRFMLIKHERVNVGGDLGFGKGSRALYFGSGESF
jgi:hypothetical protein